MSARKHERSTGGAARPHASHEKGGPTGARTEVQTIMDRRGRPAFAVVPWKEFERLRAAAEDSADRALLSEAIDTLKSGAEEPIPVNVVAELDAGGVPLRAFRRWRGLTQRALAEQTGLTQAYLSEIESGRKTPSVEVLRALARALHTDMELLLPPQA